MAMTGTLSASLIATFHSYPMNIGGVICCWVVETGDLGRGVGGGVPALPAIFRAENPY